MKRSYLWNVTLFALLAVLLFPVSGARAADPANGQIDVSDTAERGDATANADAAAKAAKRTMPADHWLAGTSNEPDMLPALIAPDAPRKMLKEFKGAYLEQIGDTRVLHLKGTHYDMGFQHGTLMKEEILIASTIIGTIGALGWEKDYKISIREAWNRTSPYIPQKYKDEIQGMADAMGITVEDVQNFTIFPEMFHCSGFALWGKATADGAMLHGRVLDYMRDAGLDKWALVIIQEPEGANPFVNIGYSGTIGSVTGMNAKHVSIGEMGGGGEEKWDGMPMTLLIRECLEMANTVEDVKRIMGEAKTTCDYYYVIADSVSKDGRGWAYGVAAESPAPTIFIEPNQYDKRLPNPIEDAVCLSAGGRYQCLTDRVKKMYGKFTPQIALDLMARGVSMSSNMHNALFKPATLELWVANSTVEEPGCNRPYHYYDLNKLINERPAQ